MLKLSDASLGFRRPSASKSSSGDAKSFLCVSTEVLFDQVGSETIETGGHGGMCGEQVSRSRDGQRDLEWLSGFFHETASTFQHGEGRMSFVQMTDFRLECQAP